MKISRWIAPVVTLSVVFWLTGAYGKENKMDQSNVNHKEADEDTRFRMGIYDTYIRLRDGVTPETSAKILNEKATDFHSASLKARTTNLGIIANNSNNKKCVRFLNLYNEVSTEIGTSLSRYLRQPDLDKETRVYLEARLHTLRLFEASLFSLVLFDAEAGYADLDPSARSRCQVSDRNEWRNEMMRTHRASELAHLAFFGEKSVNTPVTIHSSLAEFTRRYQRKNTEKKVGFISAEVLASILVWQKAIQPWLGPMNRTVKVLMNTAYITTWVTFDRYARNHVSFLKAPPEINNGKALASWDSLMEFGEQFTEAKDNNPLLYSAYIKLIESTERQRALDFLTENEWVLVNAEQQSGSVDAALHKLQEEHTL